VDHLRALTVSAVVFLAVALAAVAAASAPPVGALPAGAKSVIQTQKGELVAVSLPARANGRVWRIARAFDGNVLAQVGEADVAKTVVLVFKAKAAGTTTVTFGLTKAETAKAFESRRFEIHVR
jgi:hypothetical protein